MLRPSTTLYGSFLKHCTLTNKAVGTIWRDMSKLPQRRQGPDPRPLWLLYGTPLNLVLGPELASRRAEHNLLWQMSLYIFDILFLSPNRFWNNFYARRDGAEVAGWTLDRKIRVRFPAYPHRVWALWWQGGKWRLRTSRCPCRGRLGTLKIPSCPWRGCPAAGQNLETGHLSRHYIAEISLNVTLNHNQQQQQQQQ